MRYSKDHAIVLKKNQLLGDNVLITLFSQAKGKIVLKAYGVKKLNSRRMAHLETGNYIAFCAYEKENYATLTETELIYGYSKTRRSGDKLAYLFTYLFVLHRMLPENQPEGVFFDISLTFLKELNNQAEFSTKNLTNYFDALLLAGGFLSTDTQAVKGYDTMLFVEELIGRKISVIF